MSRISRDGANRTIYWSGYSDPNTGELDGRSENNNSQQWPSKTPAPTTMRIESVTDV